MNTKYQNVILFIIITIAFFSRLYLAIKQPAFNGSDELKHIITAKFYWENKHLSPKGELVYFKNGKSELIPKYLKYATVPYANKVYSMAPPLYHIFLSLPFAFINSINHNFVETSFLLRLTGIIMGTVSAFLFFKLTNIIKIQSPYHFILTFIYSTIPLSIFLDSTVNWDSAVSFFSLLAIVSVLLSFRKKSKLSLILSSILTGITFLIKPTAIFFVIMIIILGFVDRKNRATVIKILLISFFIILPYLVYSYNTYHQFFSDMQSNFYFPYASIFQKIQGLIRLFIKHYTFFYPKNITNWTGLLEIVRKSLVIISLVLISFFFCLGLLTSIFKKEIVNYIRVFGISIIIYIVIFIINQWKYVPDVSFIVDRSARTFAPLFFVFPFIFYLGVKETLLFLPKNNKWLWKLTVSCWLILVIQGVFL